MRRPPQRSTRTATLLPYSTRFRSVYSMVDVGRVLVLLGEGLEHLDIGLVQAGVVHGKEGAEHAPVAKHLGHYTNMQKRGQSDDAKRTVARHQHPPARSEAHTSELQSLMRISYAVFCLKQKKIIT